MRPAILGLSASMLLTLSGCSSEKKSAALSDQLNADVTATSETPSQAAPASGTSALLTREAAARHMMSRAWLARTVVVMENAVVNKGTIREIVEGGFGRLRDSNGQLVVDPETGAPVFTRTIIEDGKSKQALFHIDGVGNLFMIYAVTCDPLKVMVMTASKENLEQGEEGIRWVPSGETGSETMFPGC